MSPVPRRLSTSLLAVALAAAVAVPASAGVRDGALRDLDDPAAAVRERAFRRLRTDEALDLAVLVEALAEASPRSRPMLLELAGLRGAAGALPAVVAAAQGEDPPSADAALRAAVLLGDDAVAAVTKALDASDPRLAARAQRLRALAVRDAVERTVVSKWRRKGGTYDGRFRDLEAFGWPVQPILVAMLLDIPVEDRFLALAPDGSEPTPQRKLLGLRELRLSERRGYRPFRPTPPEVDGEELGGLAAQALADVADIDLLGPLLDDVAQDLEDAHERYQLLRGFQLRQWEDAMAETIGEILAAHGMKDRLAQRARALEMEVRQDRLWAERLPASRRARALQALASDLARLGGVRHRMREFDRAAEAYAESISVQMREFGAVPTISAYNRACALARGGRIDEALAQLDVALSGDLTDLSRDWVEEDGDMHPLVDDPRFAAILDRAFGPRGSATPAASDSGTQPR